MTSGALRRDADRLAASMPRLRLAALQVAATLTIGHHGRRRSGPGDSFWQYRRYHSGDPVKLIDWRRSARGATVLVREREREVAQTVMLWVDRSPSMSFASRRALPEKGERAVVAGLGLAAALLTADERVGWLGSRPRRGRGALEALAAELAVTPADSLPPDAPVARGAEIVLIGDFLDPTEVWLARLDRFAAAGVRLHMLQIVDPVEETLPARGRTLFSGTEGEGDYLVRRVDGVRDAYRGRFAAHRAVLADACRRRGWTFVRHRTDREPVMALLPVAAALSAPPL